MFQFCKDKVSSPKFLLALCFCVSMSFYISPQFEDLKIEHFLYKGQHFEDQPHLQMKNLSITSLVDAANEMSNSKTAFADKKYFKNGSKIEKHSGKSFESDNAAKNSVTLKNSTISSDKVNRIWISMGLCWDKNVETLGKSTFPYREAAIRSISLWRKLTEAEVILQIIHRNEQPSQDLVNFRKKIESVGAKVILRHESHVDCVVASQIVRLVASDLPFIADDDFIITSDVDAFITSKKILLPLTLKNKTFWIWNYDLTRTAGSSFQMVFIGARRKTWSEMIAYNGSITTMVQHYTKLLNLKNKNDWYLDQLIISREILERKLCSLPRENNLWKAVGLGPKEFSDLHCWHGSGLWQDCNNKLWDRNAIIRFMGGGCQWWHFYPDEGLAELDKKYREILRTSSSA